MKYLFVFLLIGLVSCGPKEGPSVEENKEIIENTIQEHLTKRDKFLDEKEDLKTIGDIIKHIEEFKDYYDIFAPQQKWGEVVKVLKNLERNFDKIPDASDEAYEIFFGNVIPAIPEDLDVRNNVIKIMNDKRNGYTN